MKARNLTRRQAIAEQFSEWHAHQAQQDRELDLFEQWQFDQKIVSAADLAFAWCACGEPVAGDDDLCCALCLQQIADESAAAEQIAAWLGGAKFEIQHQHGEEV